MNQVDSFDDTIYKGMLFSSLLRSFTPLLPAPHFVVQYNIFRREYVNSNDLYTPLKTNQVGPI